MKLQELQIKHVQAGFTRVYRGGSWRNHALFARPGYRNRNFPGNRFNVTLGFRLVRKVEHSRIQD